MELPAEWKDKDFDDPDVITAYVNYCQYMIDAFDPDYMCYGVEVNIDFTSEEEDFAQFLALIEQAYDTLKVTNPDLPLFLSFHINTYAANPSDQKKVIEQLLPYSDWMAVSTYPYTLSDKADPEVIPGNWFSQMADLAAHKPFAVAENGYAAHSLVMKQYNVSIKAKELWQASYVQFLLEEANALDARFVVWFCSRDYDAIWEVKEDLGFDELFKMWKDTGLLDEKAIPRTGLQVWDDWLALPGR